MPAGLDHGAQGVQPAGEDPQDQFLHGDWLGSTRNVSNGAGALTHSFRYDAFGKRVAGTGRPTDYLFAGAWGYQDEDDLGLQYLQQRYYDPGIGRFLSPDPIGLDGGMNLYGYCGEDPVGGVDPAGTIPSDPTKRPELHETEESAKARQQREAQRRAYLRMLDFLFILMDVPIPPSQFLGGASAARSQAREAAEAELWAAKAEAASEAQAAPGRSTVQPALARPTGAPVPPQRWTLTSVIHDSPELVRAAKTAGHSAQAEIDHVTAQLAQGNMNPGIGTKTLVEDVRYARTKNGARVFFRVRSNHTIEILAKSVKQNEDGVMKLLGKKYGTKH